jgi:hypothetical protein
MSISTNLSGRLRNTALPASGALLPLYEAVVNGIHSIEDAHAESEHARIEVRIIRDGQAPLSLDSSSTRPGPEAKGEIISFLITDNGVGFNDDNMESFRTLDSEYKASRGGRGVGRLLWLKAFERVSVTSRFEDDSGKLTERSFSFSAPSGVSAVSSKDASDVKRMTSVELHGFAAKYREACPKTARVIAKNLLEHCLWYFLRAGGAPKIEVIDDEEQISLDEILSDLMLGNSILESLEIRGQRLDLIHIKLAASSTRSHSVAFCAANRLVNKESIRGKIPGLFGPILDAEQDFIYECYVSSPVLDERVRAERTAFDVDDENLELFGSGELSHREIRDAVLERASVFLEQYLADQRRRGQERVNKFVSQKAPRYRPILSRLPVSALAVDPEITDKELDGLLHKHLAEFESKLLEDGHELLRPSGEEDYREYRTRVDKYLRDAADLKQSDLAGYVSHRRVIIDLLEMAIRRDSKGKYAREDLIHSLIMPMQTDSSEVAFDSCNLWLVDERLAFHEYLASDKSLSAMPISGATGGKEPDMLALKLLDYPFLVSEGTKLPPASLVVVEIKRPMRNDARAGEDKDPIEQALGYLDRIRQGKVTTATGRPIPESDAIPGFCYVLCDLTESVVKRCKMHDAIRTSDGLGYFFYNKTFSAYVEVISFDRLVNSAKERNRAFFDKLGLPTT